MQDTLTAVDEIRMGHQNLRKLSQRWEAEDPGSPQEDEIMNECLLELAIHSLLEEEIFYPECRRVWVTKAAILDECDDDHAKIDDMIYELRLQTGLIKSENFEVLLRDVMNHIDEEERLVLPEFENIVSIEESTQVGDRLRQRKNELRSGTIRQNRAA
jgi:hypothetical protein